MLTILKEAINVRLKLCSNIPRLLTSHLIQVRNWTVSTGPLVFTGLENVRFEPTTRRSQTSDQQNFLPLNWYINDREIRRGSPTINQGWAAPP